MKYHKEKGFPKNTVLPKGKYCFSYSIHAEKEFKTDKYYENNFILPITIDIQIDDIIEIEIDNNSKKLIKIVYRISFNKTLDLILVIAWSDKVVKTVWFNDKNDNHDTLDFTKYNNP